LKCFLLSRTHLEPVSTTHHASGRTRSRLDAEGFFQYLLGSAVAT
jgi:hypothetical protein